MKVRVLFFGATATATGMRETDVDLNDGSRLAAVTDLILKEHPALASHRLLFSINQEYADPNSPISGGDELAIFTAVSGG